MVYEEFKTFYRRVASVQECVLCVFTGPKITKFPLPVSHSWAMPDWPFLRHSGFYISTADISWFSSSLVCSAGITSMGCLAENTEEKNPSLLYSKPCALATKLRCTLMLHLLSYEAPLSYAAPYWATLHPPELHSILFWTRPYPQSYTPHSELRCTPLSCAAFYWAVPHPTKLNCTLLSYPHTLLSYAVSFWITLHLLSNAAPYWATGHLTELRSTH